MCGGFYLYRTWAYPRHIREEASLSSLDRNAHSLWGGNGILGKRLKLPPPDASVGATNIWFQCSSPSFEFPGSSLSSLSRSPIRSGEYQKKISCSFLNLTNSHGTRLCCSSLSPFFCPIVFWDNLIQFWNPKVSRTTLAVSESFSHPQPHTKAFYQGTWSSPCINLQFHPLESSYKPSFRKLFLAGQCGRLYFLRWLQQDPSSHMFWMWHWRFFPLRDTVYTSSTWN